MSDKKKKTSFIQKIGYFGLFCIVLLCICFPYIIIAAVIVIALVGYNNEGEHENKEGD